MSYNYETDTSPVKTNIDEELSNETTDALITKDEHNGNVNGYKTTVIVKTVINNSDSDEGNNGCKIDFSYCVENEENVKLQYLASFTATIALFISGMNWGWPGPTFIKMTSPTFPLHVTETHLSWMASIISLASIAGPFIAAIGVNLIGRKQIILVLAIPFFLEWILLYFSDQTLIVVYIARIIAGLAIGAALSTVPTYLGEISSPNIRGKLSNLISIQIHIGVLFSYVMGPYVSLKVSSIISIIFPIVYFVIFVFMPESPYFYIMKGDKKRAIKSLRTLRGKFYNCEMEINRITEKIIEHENNKMKLSDLFSIPVYRKVVGLTIVMFTTQHLSGGAFALAYAPTVLADINAPISTSVSIVLFAVVYLLSTILVGFLIDLYGRKCLLITSCVCTAIPLAIVGIYFLLRDIYHVDLSNYTLIPTAALIVFPLAHGIGLGSVPFVMQGELFPSNIKTVGSLIVTIYASILAFTVLKLYHPIKDLFGIHMVFFIFCGNCIIGSLFIARYVPETKNKTLEQIQDELRAK